MKEILGEQFSDYMTLVHVIIKRGANSIIDSHDMSILHIFHDKPSKDPYQHVDNHSKVHKISIFVMKIKLFPITLRYHFLGKHFFKI